MADNLTPEQRQAVEDRGGKLLVSAAAGSGKTKVLVERLLSYILDPVSPANIDEFLIITYTKAAAAELRGKIAARLSEALAEQPENQHLQHQMHRLYLAKISTVHAFCADLLREYAYNLDIPSDFRVADENECRELRGQAIEELLEEAYRPENNSPDFYAFIDTQGLGKDDRKVPEIILKCYDSARCHLNPDEWIQHCIDSCSIDDETDAAKTVWGKYLIDEMKTYLRLQITAMERCRQLTDADPFMEKPGLLLEKTINEMRYLEEAESWDDVVERKDIDYGRLTFSKKIENLESADRIKAVRDGCKSGLGKKLKIFCDPSEQVLSDLRQTGAAVRGIAEMTREFDRRYADLKRKRRILDFSDLEQKTLDLLLGKYRNTPTKTACEVGQRFREILVDEYQDSNAVQDAIFAALTEQRKNCFMVGDVKQSIYQFRLADPGIFLKKYHDYQYASDAATGEGRKVLLSRNFRSGGAILEATNDVFYRCMSREVGGLDYGSDEALAEGIAHESLNEPEVELHVLETGENGNREEAEFVANEIASLISEKHLVRDREGLRPITLDDIVILLRSPGSVGQLYQDALAAHGIPSNFGSGRDLLQTGEISTLRSILQIISNPRQDIPLIAAMMSPVYMFTADDLARIRSLKKQGDVFDAVLLDPTPKTQCFIRNLEKLREVSRTSTLAGLLEEIFCQTRMDSIYGAMKSGVEKTSNLRAFFKIAVDFERSTRKNLGQFLEYLDIMEEKGLTVADTAAGGAVEITSIHKSKGLEYPVVFLSSLSRSFNRDDLRAGVLCDGALGLGLSAVDPQTRVRYPTIAKRAIAAHISGDSLSEELRVLYVAMTRAKDRLIMTYAAKTAVNDLKKIADCIDLGGERLLAGDVTCPGEWVLMEAMCRTEAGALFSAAGSRPQETHISDYPWKIKIHQSCAETYTQEQQQPTRKTENMDNQILQQLKTQLKYAYPYAEATRMPSKQTATQRKITKKEQENLPETSKQRNWRTLQDQSLGKGKEYGKAMHALMQYVRFEFCNSVENLETEIERLIERNILTEEQGREINRDAVIAFFKTDIGEKIRTGETLREFKFSILDDAEKFGENLAGEKVLLQGVVDCALLERDGITVIDFKTDYVTTSTIDRIADRYRIQVHTYAQALNRIYEKPIKAQYLYLFHLKKLVQL